MSPSKSASRYLLLALAILALKGKQVAAQRVALHPTPEALAIPVDFIVKKDSALNTDSVLRVKSSKLRAARLKRSIGLEDGTELEVMGGIASATLDNRGRVLVLDRSYQLVRVFGKGPSESFVVGRKGNGPLDLRSGMSIWATDSGGFAIADAVLGVKFISAPTPQAKLVKMVPLTGTDIVSACPTAEGFAVYGVTRTNAKLVRVFDRDGRLRVSFGEPYRSANSLVRMIMSEGVVGCADTGRYVVALSGQPFMQIFDNGGKHISTLKIQEFTVGYQEEAVAKNGRTSIGLAAETKRFSYIARLVSAGEGTMLVQVAHHDQRSLRAREDYAQLDTYLVDTKNPRGLFVGSSVPPIASVHPGGLVAFTNDPFPQVSLLEVAR